MKVRTACPICAATMTSRYGKATDRTRIRHLVYRHMTWHHPGLGVRERSLLIDRAAGDVA